MTRGVKLKEMLSRLPTKRRHKLDARAVKLISNEMSLRERREVLGEISDSKIPRAPKQGVGARAKPGHDAGG